MSEQSQTTYAAATAVIEGEQWEEDAESTHARSPMAGLIEKLVALLGSDSERFDPERFAEASRAISQGYSRWRRNGGGPWDDIPSPAGDTEYRWDR